MKYVVMYKLKDRIAGLVDTTTNLIPSEALKFFDIYKNYGYIELFDANSINASKLIAKIETVDQLENFLAAEEREHWFKNNPTDIVKDTLEKQELPIDYERLKAVRNPLNEPVPNGVKMTKKDFMQNIEKIAEIPVDSNLKTAAAIGKPTFEAIPPIAIFGLGAAMADGAKKYGRYNWRSTEVTASVFYNAMLRHLFAWWSGEDYALDSLIHHLNHLQASAAIIQDAQLHNVFNDDRNPSKDFDIEAMMRIIKNESHK
jgi:hypothetical protein